MKQQTLAMAADQGAGFEIHRKRTQRDGFLDTMNEIVPWTQLCAVIEPYYPKRGNGRPAADAGDGSRSRRGNRDEAQAYAARRVFRHDEPDRAVGGVVRGGRAALSEKRGNGRPPIGLERMLRIHFVQRRLSFSGQVHQPNG
jgi:hypothetical protein